MTAAPPQSPQLFSVRGTDGRDYPADLPTIRQWIADGTIRAATQVYSYQEGRWSTADELGALTNQFATIAKGSKIYTQAPRQALPFQLAKASWIAPLLIIGVNFFLKQGSQDPSHGATQSVVFAVFAFVLGAAGLGSGTAALFTIKKYGRKGILVPALVGCLLSGLYVAVFLSAMFRAAGSR